MKIVITSVRNRPHTGRYQNFTWREGSWYLNRELNRIEKFKFQIGYKLLKFKLTNSPPPTIGVWVRIIKKCGSVWLRQQKPISEST